MNYIIDIVIFKYFTSVFCLVRLTFQGNFLFIRIAKTLLKSPKCFSAYQNDINLNPIEHFEGSYYFEEGLSNEVLFDRS